MIKYIADSSTTFKGLKNGMEKNPTVWANQADTPAKMQEKIDLLDSTEKEIEGIKEQLAVKQIEAHKLCAELDEYAARVTSIVIGLEGNNQEKLLPYGIKLRKPVAKKSVPTKVLQSSITDDTDGSGFIISTLFDSDADIYEWQKGAGADPAKTDVIPEMKLFKTTTKTTYVDDDVQKGVRYFYRVRSINAAGEGPWSEAVSRVQ